MLLGILATLLGALLLASLRIIERKLLGQTDPARRLDDAVLALVKWTGIVVVGLALFALAGNAREMTTEYLTAIAITGVLNVFITILTLKALADRDTEATLTVPVMDTTPVIIVFFSWIILGQKPTALGYVGIALLVLGTYTLNLNAFVEKCRGGKWTLGVYLAPFTELMKKRGIKLAFGAAAIGCVAINFDGKAALLGDPFLGAALVGIPSVVVNLVRSVKRGTLKQFGESERMHWFFRVVYPLGFGAVICLYWWSLQSLIVPYQATLKRFETLVFFVFAYVILKERQHAKTRLAATAIIVLGGILIALSA